MSTKNTKGAGGINYESRSFLRWVGIAHPGCRRHPEADGANRLPAGALARDEVLRPLRSQGFHSVSWVPGRRDQEVFSGLQRMRLQRFRHDGWREKGGVVQ